MPTTELPYQYFKSKILCTELQHTQTKMTRNKVSKFFQLSDLDEGAIGEIYQSIRCGHFQKASNAVSSTPW